jgi:hypothetical protein
VPVVVEMHSERGAPAAAVHGALQAEMVYTEACPFEPEVVDEQALEAAGARDVTGHSTGVKLPAGRSTQDDDEG